MKKNYISVLITISFFTVKANAQILTMPLDGNVNDISGHNNNGVIHGNIIPANNRLGTPNTAYHFPGTQNDFIYLAPSWANYDFNITQSDSFSVSLWMQPENNSLNQYAFAKRDTLWSTSQVSDYDITMAQGIIGSRFNLGYTADYNDYISTNPQKWYNVVVTYSNGLSKLYVNDTLRGSNASSPIDSIATTIIIGQYFKGEIDDINFFKKALTATEVDNLYRIGSVTGVKTPIELASEIFIYPNPSNDFVNIKNSSNKKIRIELLDINGKTKFIEKTDKDLNLSLEGYPNGDYTIRVIDTQNKLSSYKFIKQ
jgi:hypothetical protein